MSERIEDLKVGLDEQLEEVLSRISDFSQFRILKKSIDARKSPPHFVYNLEVFKPGEVIPEDVEKLAKIRKSSNTPKIIIIGAGPAGLFAAVRLAERGISSQIFERGSQTAKRLQGIARFWRYGKIDPNNNVCYGEGGAGLYSDGKLITRIKSPFIPYVLDRLVRFGAPNEIKYLSNPHVGSDRIRKIIPPIRNYLISQGCEFFFDTKVEKVLFEGNQTIGIETSNGSKFLSPHVILATGHSAIEVYHHLHENQVTLEGKSFAVGLRIEHPQKEINKIQFKDFAEHPALGPATYRLAEHDPKSDIGVYSFCMCPGGYVVSSGTEQDTVVSNGMSNYARNSPFANSALVVSINYTKLFGSEVFAGLNYVRGIEKKAKKLVEEAGGNQELPAQSLEDFLKGRVGEVFPNSSPSKAIPAPLHDILPKSVYNRLYHALHRFDRKMPGFISSKAQLFGVETRTSAPIRIPRDPETYQSVSHKGLYPTGEGAGYAGGITSAAVDGVRVAESIFRQLT